MEGPKNKCEECVFFEDCKKQDRRKTGEDKACWYFAFKEELRRYWLCGKKVIMNQA